MKIIIPMAGLGTRFQKAAAENPEYLKPKPLISVRGLPMVCWATASLPFLEHPGGKVNGPFRALPKDLIFIILREHDQVFGLREKLQELYSKDAQVIVLDKVTRGAAETAYAAKDLVNEEEDLIISDSDHHFDGSPLADLIRKKDPDTAGIIPVFVPPNDGIPRWSYSLVKEGGNIIEQVGEKDAELMNKGAYANIGAYYFSKAKEFFNEVEEVMARNELTGDEGKKEFYIAPLYQNFIRKGKKIQAAKINEVWGLGTPQDLQAFLSHYPITTR